MYNVNESCYSKKTLTVISSATAKALYFYIQWTGRLLCKPDFYIHRSNMPSYELLYTINGEGKLIYEGKSFSLTPGSVMFIDCTKTHEYFPLSDKWEFAYVHFNGAMSKEYYEHFKKLNNSSVVTGAHDTVTSFFRTIELVETSGAEELYSDAVYGILIKLINISSSRNMPDRSLSRIKEALAYVSENYTKSITVDTLAELAHMSRSRFSVVFKENTGISPYQYINEYRINVAKRMLYSTGKTISEIASECGFPDSSSFIRTFKRTEKISPLAYRKAVTKRQR